MVARGNDVAKYASPEQATGSPAQPKSDVYSLCLTLVEAITGARPSSATRRWPPWPTVWIACCPSPRTSVRWPRCSSAPAGPTRRIAAPPPSSAGPSSRRRSTSRALHRCRCWSTPCVHCLHTVAVDAPVEPTGPLTRPSAPPARPSAPPADAPQAAAPPAAAPPAAPSAPPAAPAAPDDLPGAPVDALAPVLAAGALPPVSSAPTEAIPPEEMAPAAAAAAAAAAPVAQAIDPDDSDPDGGDPGGGDPDDDDDPDDDFPDAPPAPMGTRRWFLALLALLAVAGGAPAWWNTRPDELRIPSVAGLETGRSPQRPRRLQRRRGRGAARDGSGREVTRTDPPADTRLLEKGSTVTVYATRARRRGPPGALRAHGGRRLGQADRPRPQGGARRPGVRRARPGRTVISWTVPDSPSLTAGDTASFSARPCVSSARRAPSRGLSPSLPGMTLEQATAALEALGLTVDRVDDEYSTSVPACEVARQDPAPGTEVPWDSAVTIAISKGPEVTTLPPLAGKTLEQIRVALKVPVVCPHHHGRPHAAHHRGAHPWAVRQGGAGGTEGHRGGPRVRAHAHHHDRVALRVLPPGLCCH